MASLSERFTDHLPDHLDRLEVGENRREGRGGQEGEGRRPHFCKEIATTVTICKI